MAEHLSDPGEGPDAFQDAEGWYWARCGCGFKRGPLPDVETVVDSLMEHAREMGIRDEARARG